METLNFANGCWSCAGRITAGRSSSSAVCPTPPTRQLALVKSVAAESSQEVRIDLNVNSRQHGANRKISNLINMAPLAQAELLAIIDSDILVGPDHLSELASELERPGVGAVTCLYHGVGGVGLWSSLAALSINADFLPEHRRGAHPRSGAPMLRLDDRVAQANARGHRRPQGLRRLPA